MMFQAMLKWVRVCLVLLTVCAACAWAGADTVKLKDGSVLEGKITREGDRFIFISVEVGGITQEKFVMRDQIESIRRDADADPSKDQPADTQEGKEPGDEAAPGTHPTRVAVLNFGPPSSWQGEAGNTVGIHISAENFRSVIPLLERDKTDVVVVRINSGGGALSEMVPFHEVFKEYKKKFRTVTWIESAISCAAMSPWVIEEQYMMPQGNIGACTAWGGRLIAAKGVSLEQILYDMEKASAEGKHDYRIMRAMEILDAPLSATVDPVTGVVTFSQDLSGDIVLNRPEDILTLTADQAEKIKFSRGTAATLDELMKVMGIPEYELVGEQASKKVDEYMRNATRLENQFGELYRKYTIAVQAAGALQGDDNKTRRGAEVGIARRHLNTLRGLININENFQYQYGTTPEWFEAQERMLRELAG